MCSGFAKLYFLALRAAVNHKLHYAVFNVCVHTRTHTHTHTHSPPKNIHHAPPSLLHTHFPHHAFPWASVKANCQITRITKNAIPQKKNGQFIKYARWRGNNHLHVRPATCTAKMIASIFTVASRYRRLTVQGSTNTFCMTANTPV